MRVFQKDYTLECIKSALIGDKDTLNIGRGIYDIYENLDLGAEKLTEIADRAEDYLKTIKGFISVKVLFPRLFKDSSSTMNRYGSHFGPYMLLSILRDDPRFKTRRGLMAGLVSDKTGFTTMSEDITAILSRGRRPMTVMEVTTALGDRRDVVWTSVYNVMKTSDLFISDQGRFTLAKG